MIRPPKRPASRLDCTVCLLRDLNDDGSDPIALCRVSWMLDGRPHQNDRVLCVDGCLLKQKVFPSPRFHLHSVAVRARGLRLQLAGAFASGTPEHPRRCWPEHRGWLHGASATARHQDHPCYNACLRLTCKSAVQPCCASARMARCACVSGDLDLEMANHVGEWVHLIVKPGVATHPNSCMYTFPGGVDCGWPGDAECFGGQTQCEED